MICFHWLFTQTHQFTTIAQWTDRTCQITSHWVSDQSLQTCAVHSKLPFLPFLNANTHCSPEIPGCSCGDPLVRSVRRTPKALSGGKQHKTTAQQRNNLSRLSGVSRHLAPASITSSTPDPSSPFPSSWHWHIYGSPGDSREKPERSERQSAHRSFFQGARGRQCLLFSEDWISWIASLSSVAPARAPLINGAPTQEIWVLELILSPPTQTMLDILLGHAHYKTPWWITPTLLCVGAPHDRGVEKTVHGLGSRPSTANKKLTDLELLAEQRPDLPAVSPGHRLHWTVFSPLLFFLNFFMTGSRWTIKSITTHWSKLIIFKGTSVKIYIYQRMFRDAQTPSLTCWRAGEIVIPLWSSSGYGQQLLPR